MHPNDREYFDRHLEEVLEALPQRAKDLLEEVPLYVEDYPSAKVMRQMGIRHRTHLLGLYTGIPLIDRHMEGPPVLSDVVQIYREGILSYSSRHTGRVDETELRDQIRRTILHELGHHHGMSEEDLEELGY